MSNTIPATAPVVPAVLQPYAMSFPAAAPANAHWTDRVVAVGHVEYCALMGHATHTIDGVDQGYCPRCGEPTAESTPAPDYYRHSVDCARHSGNVPCTKDCDRRRVEADAREVVPVADAARLVTTCTNCGQVHECYIHDNGFRYTCGNYSWPVADINVRPETAKAAL